MVLVTVSDGALEGEVVFSDIGGMYFSFKGIPYAAPPIGDLRFKAPEPPEPWEGIRSAKKHGNQSYQFNFVTRAREMGSEDSLYLNVYTPDLNPTDPLPVMIWIYGGGFVCGNGNDDSCGPDFLIRNDVIVVTFNYRMEILGFLCLNTPDVPGNAGVKDQVAAMKWVKKNISNFGGDPENITIFGQSTGAACVSYHCVSPMTKGLFKRAICQSGTISNWWAKSYRPRERAEALARKLGCASNDDKELYEFFRNQPIESLVEVQVPITFAEKEKDKYETQFAVVSEKVFDGIEPYFTGDFIKAVYKDVHKDVELIVGYNENEGVLSCGITFDFKTSMFLINNFKEYLVPKSMALYCSVDDQFEVGKIFKEHYFKDNKQIVEKIEKFFGIESFKFDIWQSAKMFSKSNRVYFYKFNCRSDRNFFGKLTGISKYIKDKVLVGHNDDMAYLFPIKSLNQKFSRSSETFRMINNLTKLWTNFAKLGNPTPDLGLGVTWKHFNAESQQYLEIGNKLIAGTAPDKEEFSLWEDVFRKYQPSRIYHDETIEQS